MRVAIERVLSPAPEAAALVGELDALLGAVYEPHQRHGMSIEQVFEPHVRFFIARIGREAVGCGAVALFDGYAEVKRMYTREAVRSRGVGKALLARLEAEARRAGKPMLGSKPAPSRRRRSGVTRAMASGRALLSGITTRWSRTASQTACSTKCLYSRWRGA